MTVFAHSLSIGISPIPYCATKIQVRGVCHIQGWGVGLGLDWWTRGSECSFSRDVVLVWGFIFTWFSISLLDKESFGIQKSCPRFLGCQIQWLKQIDTPLMFGGWRNWGHSSWGRGKPSSTRVLYFPSFPLASFQLHIGLLLDPITARGATRVLRVPLGILACLDSIQCDTFFLGILCCFNFSDLLTSS